DLNNPSGRVGTATLASTNTNATRHPAPTIKPPKTRGFRHPRLGDSTKPVTTAPSPAVARIVPNQSICPAPLLRLCGIRQSEIATTATAIGRLRKNAHRQEACSTSQPPSTGPTAAVIAVKPDHVP